MLAVSGHRGVFERLDLHAGGREQIEERALLPRFEAASERSREAAIAEAQVARHGPHGLGVRQEFEPGERIGFHLGRRRRIGLALAYTKTPGRR